MKTTLLNILSVLFVATLLLVGPLGCGSENAPDDASHTHGPDTHTHDTTADADTAGTYADTTVVEMDMEGNHEHGPDTHTHDEDTPAHQ